MTASRFQRRKVSIILSTAASILTAVLGLVFSRLLLNAFTSSTYGAYQTITAYASYVFVLNCGIGSVFTRYVSIYLQKGDKEGEARFIGCETLILISVIAIMVVAGLVMFFCIPYVFGGEKYSDYIHDFDIVFIILISEQVIKMLSLAENGIIYAYEKYGTGSIGGFLTPIIKYSVLAALLTYTKNIYIVAISSICATAIIFIYQTIYVFAVIKPPISFKKTEKEVIKGSLLFSLATICQAIVNEANGGIDKLVLSLTIGLEDVTTYSFASQICTMFSSFSTAATGVFLPAFARNFQKGLTPPEEEEEMRGPNRMFTLLSGLILFGFLSCGYDFIIAWVGEEQAAAYYMALILMFPYFFQYMIQSVYPLMDAKNLKLFQCLALAITAAINIGLTVLFVYWFGPYGAPTATAVAVVIGNLIIMNIYYHKKLHLRVFRMYGQSAKGILPAYIIAAALAGSTYLFIPDSLFGVYGFLIRGFTFVILAAIFMLSFGFDQGEKDMIRNRLRKKPRAVPAGNAQLPPEEPADPEKENPLDEAGDGDSERAERG